MPCALMSSTLHVKRQGRTSKALCLHKSSVPSKTALMVFLHLRVVLGLDVLGRIAANRTIPASLAGA